MKHWQKKVICSQDLRVEDMKRVTMLRVICLISMAGFLATLAGSCGLVASARARDQERQKFELAIKNGNDFDAKLNEDAKQWKKEYDALIAQIEKHKQKESSFITSLSDKELLALSDYQKATAEENGALATLTGRKFITLLVDSGKIAAYMTNQREYDELLVRAKVVDKKQEELKERDATSKKFWASMKQLAQEKKGQEQHRELIDALNGINNSIWLNSQQQIWIQQMRAGQQWIQQNR
jgi:hypothetical protein